jgi:transmembrane sensor
MSELDWDLVDRYLAGAATPAEREQFDRWLAEEPNRAAMLERLRRALDVMASDVTPEEQQAVWERVAERTGITLPVLGAGAPGEVRAAGVAPVGLPPRRRGIRLALAVAAALAGAVLVGRGVLLDRVSTESPAEERIVRVPRGERARFRLPDGSEVVVSGGGVLRHPRVFPAGAREVALEGEAYFRVEHDGRRPFRVRAGNLVATDLGTEFLVRAYAEDEGARVVVREGSVAVRAFRAADTTHPGHVIRAGELGRLGADGAARIEQADTAAYFAWTTGTLVFDGTPLRDALPQLAGWYDLDFRLADSAMGSIPLSGRLDQTLTPARLDLLAGSMGLEQVRREKTVTFYRIGAAPK